VTRHGIGCASASVVTPNDCRRSGKTMAKDHYADFRSFWLMKIMEFVEEAQEHPRYRKAPIWRRIRLHVHLHDARNGRGPGPLDCQRLGSMVVPQLPLHRDKQTGFNSFRFNVTGFTARRQ
jgi:hypothetical protein